MHYLLKTTMLKMILLFCLVTSFVLYMMNVFSENYLVLHDNAFKFVPRARSPLANELLASCPKVPMNSDQDFYKYTETSTLPCHNLSSIGDALNLGDKKVCFDAKFNLQPGNCIVFSFGINDEWSFDDGMDDLGCKVYAFDPTMRDDNHQRSPNVRFFNLGLSDEQAIVDIDYEHDNNKQRKVDRYVNILTRLGLLQATIDYVKVDIEGYELKWFSDMVTNTPELLLNIKMIGVELHAFNYPVENLNSLYQELWLDLHRMECLGFRVMDCKLAPYVTAGGDHCYELLLARDIIW